VRDLGIGQPINPEECSETADGVARESEGRSRLPHDGIGDLVRELGHSNWKIEQGKPLEGHGQCLMPKK
jgi:hypothetical protein